MLRLREAETLPLGICARRCQLKLLLLLWSVAFWMQHSRHNQLGHRFDDRHHYRIAESQVGAFDGKAT